MKTSSNTDEVVEASYKKLENPCFTQPEDDSIRVWRYLDLAKFIWLLENQKLYFSRLDLLGDPHEGSLPQFVADRFYSEHLNYDLALNYKKLVSEFGSEEGTLRFQAMVPHLIIQTDHMSNQQRSNNKSSSTHYYVNCWHMNNSESEAMWRLYCPNNNGIAIQTTYKKLVESTISDEYLHIGQVKYIDYESEVFPMDNVYYKLMHKRNSFVHEQEVRLIKTEIPQNWGTPQEVCLEGLEFDWAFENIIDAIHVNPYAPNYYLEVILKVVERVAPKLKNRVVWSKMRAEPNY